MVQSIKGSLCEHKNLSLIPRTQVKKKEKEKERANKSGSSSQSQHWGDSDGQISGADRLVSSRPEGLCLKIGRLHS